MYGPVVAGAPYSAEETNTSVRTERSLIDPVARKRKADAPVIVEITDPIDHVKYTFVTANKVVANKAVHKQTIAAPQPDHPLSLIHI